MSVNTSAGVTPNAFPQPPNPELPAALGAFLVALRPTIYILLFCAVWLGISIPILIILFFTSTRKLRRSGIFISNAIGIFIGITMGVLNLAIETDGILNPIKGLSHSEVIAYTFIASSAGIYVDCILLFRVLVVFPKTTTPRRLWFSIVTPLVLFKLARFINFIVFMISFGLRSRSVTSTAQYEPIARKLVGEIIEWSLQLADNALCSCLFLWRLNQAQSFSGRTVTGSRLRSSSYYKALGDLFWIAATNFVFPCLFDIVMFVLFYRDPDGTHYLIVLISNAYVQIIGVLFATVWSATHHEEMSTVEGSIIPPRAQELTQIRFAPNQQEAQISNDTVMTRADIELSSREKNIGPSE